MNTLNTSALSADDRIAYERGVWRWSAQLQDQDGVGIPSSSMTSVVLSIVDAATGTVLVNRRDIKNANGGTLDADGIQTVVLQGADNKVLNPRLAREVHRVTVDYAWDSNLKRHWHVIELTVLNHPEIH